MEPLPTVSQLVIDHLRRHIDHYYKEEEHLRTKCGVPSLTSLAADAMVRYLEEEDDIHAAAIRLIEEFDLSELRLVVNNPKATYRLLRTLNDVHVEVGRCALDLDDAIIRNERFLRHRVNLDGKYLITLEDFVDMLPNKTFNSRNVVSFTRKSPPKGGLEVLDHCRESSLWMLANGAAFWQTLDRVTQGILRGLDWSNVILAGDMVLKILLHTDPSKDDEDLNESILLDLYIHGLDQQSANQKAEQIYETWNTNLSGWTERILVKTSRTLSYRAKPPHRAIRITLKLYPSPTEVLLDFDLDPNAVAYDGSSIFMLPRCARALETGYTNFATELIYGHHLAKSARSAVAPARLFYYATLGFGLRFRPSFANLLQADQCTQKDRVSWIDRIRYKSPCADEQRDRFPFDPLEPGLLTLKRVAYIGQDYVHRLHYGPTPLTAPSSKYVQRDADEWQRLMERGAVQFARLTAFNDQARIFGGRLLGPMISRNDLVSDQDIVNTNGGLQNFEVFSRLCEAWRLADKKEASLLCDRWEDGLNGFEPAQNIFDFLKPHDLAGIQELSRHVESSNSISFRKMASLITSRLQLSRQWTNSDFRNYLTRRIRVKVTSFDDFETIRRKQIVIPVMITQELEAFIAQVLREYMPDTPESFTPLIPVHDTAMHDANTSSLPSLRDATGETENFRYWIITETSQWKGQHRVMDEVVEVLLCLREVFESLGERHPKGLHFLQEKFSARDAELLDEDRRDLLLFRQWVLPSPPPVAQSLGWTEKIKHEGGHHVHSLFNGDVIRYPFPNGLFWNEGDEGEWGSGKDGFPEWREPTPTPKGDRAMPVEKFDKPNDLRTERISELGGAFEEETNFICDHELYGENLQFVNGKIF